MSHTYMMYFGPSPLIYAPWMHNRPTLNILSEEEGTGMLGNMRSRTWWKLCLTVIVHTYMMYFGPPALILASNQCMVVQQCFGDKRVGGMQHGVVEW